MTRRPPSRGTPSPSTRPSTEGIAVSSHTPARNDEGATSRVRLAAVLVWGTLVTAVLAVVPLALRDRLPDPLAAHWSGGSTPDGHLSLTGDLLAGLLLWGVVWAALIGFALHRTVLSTRLGRAYWWGFFAGWPVFVLGVQGLTLFANLGVADWRRAVLPGWTVVVVIGSAGVAGVLAGLLGRGAPDKPREHPRPPSLRLRPGRRAVWVGRTVNPWLVGLSTVSLLGALVVGALGALGTLNAEALGIGLLVLVPVTLLGLGTASVGVRVDQEGLRVGFGPFGRPSRHTPIDQIESAWAERRTPAQVGGWGLRALPGTRGVTLMLRGGDCLVVRRVTGGEFAVSVDDAERGAALLNAYRAEAVS
ncbi:hypothetical protein GCM10017673_02980 [Streptosporangium violaceochromogenes]|nr:hypothetical protein GCM10017673_02980 [Streptosporangium violaceochromogenes]